MIYAPTNEGRAEHIADILHTRPMKLQADFEHGQWWITDTRNGAQYSVVDAEGGPAVNGFDLEQVTEGDE